MSRFVIKRPLWALASLGLIVVALVAANLTGCIEPRRSDAARFSRSLDRFEYTRLLMGVQTRIVLYAEGEDAARRAATAAFERVNQLDEIMSDYRGDSELMRLCDGSAAGLVRVGEDLFRIIERAGEISAATDDAFDITVGPLVRLWRRARETRMPPREAELSAARALVDWRMITLNAGRRGVELRKPGMRLDLGGIAKGYASQAAFEVLERQKTPRALVALSGDIYAGDPPPGQGGWRVDARSGGRDQPAITLSLSRIAVSTSGDAEQYVEFEGRRYSHIVDPRTGLGVTNRCWATVIAADGATADALASALCIHGPERGVQVARRFPGVEACIGLLADEAQVVRTDGFDRFAADASVPHAK